MDWGAASMGGGGGADDPFDIPGKGAPVERLKKWRQAALVLNASRRFRYTLDLKKKEQKEEAKMEIRGVVSVIRAAYRFKEAAAAHVNGPLGFGINEEDLTAVAKFHNFSALHQYGGVSGVANILKTDTKKGISGDDSDMKRRQVAFGRNTYPRKKEKGFLAFVWDACKDLTLVILMVTAAVLLALGIVTEGIKEGWYDGASIGFAVLLVVFVTAITDYKQSLQFEHLNGEKQNIQLEVVRGGRRVMVSIYDLVVGDVVALKIGDQVPASGILISGHSLCIDESSMTGERRIVNKDQQSPFLMSGCKVADGYGTMLVTAVGIKTEWGDIMASISEDSGEETPLQVRLNGITTFIGIIGVYVAVLVMIVLVARYFTGHSYNPDGSPQYVKGKMGLGVTMRGLVKIFTVAITIVVLAVPEGLPLALTLTLAFSMPKMMRDKALVRRLSACETMGAATVICTDKTGTLTLNQMTVIAAYFGGKKMTPTDSTDMLCANVLNMIIQGIAQNTSGSIFEPEGGKDPEVTGSPTEKAILSWGLQLGMKFNETRSKSSILQVIPFNSDKKRGGVAVHVGGSEVHVYWKGAAELILESCTDWLDTDGSKHSMTPEKVDECEKLIEDMAKASLRCVAFAYTTCEMSDVPNEDQRANWMLPEENLIMLCIVGIEDPCRPRVRDSIHLCRKAGIKVCMVTGDNLRTAIAIALQSGIITDEDVPERASIVMEGKRFRALSEAQRKNEARVIRVMGRASPNDKLLFVKALRSLGNVVAVTGDGTRDAPALHEADIGLSMGIHGTEVVKESSDIIILDDSFASVVRFVRWGRSVYANIQKFIQFQLTVNAAALIINVVSAVSSGDVPLNAVQLIWVNLIMDTLGALAIATEPPSNHLMRRPPVGRRETLLTPIMWRNLFTMVFFQVVVHLTLNFRGHSLLQLTHHNLKHAEKVKTTFIFNTFVLCQVLNEFNARKPDQLNIFKGITRSHIFMTSIVTTVLLQVLIIEFLGKFMSTVRLSWQLWLVSIGLAFLSWPLALLGKLVPVPDCCPWKKEPDVVELSPGSVPPTAHHQLTVLRSTSLKLEGMGVLKGVAADMFYIGGYKWCLEYYADGISAQEADYAAVVLCLCSPVVPKSGVEVLFTLTATSSNVGDVKDGRAAKVIFRPSETFRAWENALLIRKSWIREADFITIWCEMEVQRWLDAPGENVIRKTKSKL